MMFLHHNPSDSVLAGDGWTCRGEGRSMQRAHTPLCTRGRESPYPNAGRRDRRRHVRAGQLPRAPTDGGHLIAAARGVRRLFQLPSGAMRPAPAALARPHPRGTGQQSPSPHSRRALHRGGPAPHGWACSCVVRSRGGAARPCPGRQSASGRPWLDVSTHKH